MFLKGCPLRCRWCHNPETQRAYPQAMVLFSRCVQCGACARCPNGARGARGEYDSARCRGCGFCVSVCPAEACRVSGTVMTPREVLARILPDKPFFRSRGGVTLTGGEPMYQADFACALAELLHREDIGVVLETCGHAPREAYDAIRPFISRFLFDWKITDPEAHRYWTGAGNGLIRGNLQRLHDGGAQIVLRCPVIPGVNDTEAHFAGIARLTEECPRILRVELLPYHALGNDKRAQLSLPADSFEPPSGDAARRWREALQAMCRVPVLL